MKAIYATGIVGCLHGISLERVILDREAFDKLKAKMISLKPPDWILGGKSREPPGIVILTTTPKWFVNNLNS